MNAGAIEKQRRRKALKAERRAAKAQRRSAQRPAREPRQRRAPRVSRRRGGFGPGAAVPDLGEPLDAAAEAVQLDTSAIDEPLIAGDIDLDGDVDLDDITARLADPALDKKARKALMKLYRRAYKKERREAREERAQSKVDNKALALELGVPFLEDELATVKRQRNIAQEALGIGGDNLPGTFAGEALDDGAAFDTAALLAADGEADGEAGGEAGTGSLPSWAWIAGAAVGGLALWYFMRRRK